MIVDGRTNNARFMQKMLKRSYEVRYHEGADVTTFELNETRLGKKISLDMRPILGQKLSL